MPDPVLLVSCERAVNRVPPRYDGLFQKQPEVLAGHRGFDAGALALAEAIAGQADAPSIQPSATWGSSWKSTRNFVRKGRVSAKRCIERWCPRFRRSSRRRPLERSLLSMKAGAVRQPDADRPG